MRVRVKYFGVIREIAGKRDEIVEVFSSIILLDLLRILTANYGSSMESYLFEPNVTTPRPIHLYLVNGKAFNAEQTSGVILGEGSVVSIIPTQGG